MLIANIKIAKLKGNKYCSRVSGKLFDSLKTLLTLTQKVLNIKNKHGIKMISIYFPPVPNPLKTEQINYCIEIRNTRKKETHPLELKCSALETINTK